MSVPRKYTHSFLFLHPCRISFYGYIVSELIHWLFRNIELFHFFAVKNKAAMKNTFISHFEHVQIDLYKNFPEMGFLALEVRAFVIVIELSNHPWLDWYPFIVPLVMFESARLPTASTIKYMRSDN